MSSRSPRSVSADLAAANAALDVCAALLRAQGEPAPEKVEEPPAPVVVQPPDPSLEAAREKLEAAQAKLDGLYGAVRAATTPFENDTAHADVAAVAKEIMKAAAAAATSLRSQLEAAKAQAAQAAQQPHAPTAPPPAQPTQPAQRDYKTQRALRAAIDRYFSYFEIPGTQWQIGWRLLDASGMPTAVATGLSPGEILGSYPIPLPEQAPWRVATKLAALEAPASKAIAISAGTKPVSAAKFFLVGLSFAGGSGSITLSRSKKKMNGALRVDFPEDGVIRATPLDASGSTPIGPATPQDPATNSYLEAVWWKLCAAAMGLIHARGDATMLAASGTPVESHAEPAAVAKIIMDANESLFAKVDGEIDDAMRAKLSAKFDGVPEHYRERFSSPLLARGSNPPVFSDDDDAAKTMVDATTEAAPPAAAPTSAEAETRVIARPAAPEPSSPDPELAQAMAAVSGKEVSTKKADKVLGQRARELVAANRVPSGPASTDKSLGNAPPTPPVSELAATTPSPLLQGRRSSLRSPLRATERAWLTSRVRRETRAGECRQGEGICRAQVARGFGIEAGRCRRPVGLGGRRGPNDRARETDAVKCFPAHDSSRLCRRLGTHAERCE